MDLFFCDRCNTSIPQRDVDAGIAILRAGRAFCASCKRIVTGEEAPRDVLFCDLCNVSISLADMREERALFREGRLYCPKCKFLVVDRTTTSAGVATSASISASGVAPPPVQSTRIAVASPAIEPPATPLRRPRPWLAWGLLVGVGAAVGFAFFQFQPELRRLLSGEPIASARPGESSGAAISRPPSPRSDAHRNEVQEVDLQKYFDRVDERIDALKADLEKSRAADRAERRNELDDLKSETARVLESQREKAEALVREVDGLRATLATLDRARIEPPMDPQIEIESASSSTAEPEAKRVTENAGAAPVDASPLARELERLKSPDAGVRFSAVVELGRLGDVGAIPALGALAINDGDNYVRDFAVRVLASFGVPASVPYLVRALKDADLLVASSANEGLVRITKRSFGFDRKATPEQRQESIRKWEDWWEKNRETFK